MPATLSTTSTPTAEPRPESQLSLPKTAMLKLYHGYGDNNRVLVLGQLFFKPPATDARYSNNILRNAIALVRMFNVKPASGGIRIRVEFGNEFCETTTADDGFFALDWDSALNLEPGWHTVRASVAQNPAIRAEGTIYIPPPDGIAFVSDIDDTFLISYSSNLLQRLRVLLTKNARTRMPFEGVVEHYKELADSNVSPGTQHPFFYVSSSEWNLYDYIKEFCRFHELPEGVFLLSPIKTLRSFWKSGQGKHSAKYVRIARLLKEFPALQFVLLGDDSQKDPFIYLKLVQDFPGRIPFVYLRHRVPEHLTIIRGVEQQMKDLGVEVCYFTHSTTAREHSLKHGLSVR
jgi:phosphatidate phosphatase APP1